MDTYSFGYTSAAFSDMPINQKVFLAQFNAIKASPMKVRVYWSEDVLTMRWRA